MPVYICKFRYAVTAKCIGLSNNINRVINKVINNFNKTLSFLLLHYYYTFYITVTLFLYFVKIPKSMGTHVLKSQPWKENLIDRLSKTPDI